jgi:hypothetical protein
MGTPTRMACPEDMVRLPTSLSSPYLPFDSSNLNLQMHEVSNPFVASLEACRGCYGDLSGHAEPGFKGDSGRLSAINLSPSLLLLELMSCSAWVVAATQESLDPWEALRVVESVRGHEEKRLVDVMYLKWWPSPCLFRARRKNGVSEALRNRLGMFWKQRFAV